MEAQSAFPSYVSAHEDGILADPSVGWSTSFVCAWALWGVIA